VQNVTRDGARYVFDALSDDKGQKITIVGQAKNSSDQLVRPAALASAAGRAPQPTFSRLKR
jgi:hypothetical protein